MFYKASFNTNNVLLKQLLYILFFNVLGKLNSKNSIFMFICKCLQLNCLLTDYSSQ